MFLCRNNIDIFNKQVKAIEGNKRKQMEDSETDEELPSLDIANHYKQMLELVKPGETVQKAICRLGGSKGSSRSASSRWKKRKNKEGTSGENVDNEMTPEENADKENFEKLQLLTRLADDIIQSGDMDIYQQTYEKMSFHVNLKSNGRKTSPSEIADAALDMFGDDFDENVDETRAAAETEQTSSVMSSMYYL